MLNEILGITPPTEARRKHRRALKIIGVTAVAAALALAMMLGQLRAWRQDAQPQETQQAEDPILAETQRIARAQARQQWQDDQQRRREYCNYVRNYAAAALRLYRDGATKDAARRTLSSAWNIRPDNAESVLSLVFSGTSNRDPLAVGDMLAERCHAQYW